MRAPRRRRLPSCSRRRHCLVCHATYDSAHCGRCHRSFRDFASFDAHLVGGPFGQPPQPSPPLQSSLEGPACLEPWTSEQHPGQPVYRSVRNRWGTEEYQLHGYAQAGYVQDDNGLPCAGCGRQPERRLWRVGPTHCPQCHDTASTHCKQCHLSFHCGECYEAHRGHGEVGTVCFTPTTLAAMPWQDRMRRGVRALRGPRVNRWGTT